MPAAVYANAFIDLAIAFAISGYAFVISGFAFAILAIAIVISGFASELGQYVDRLLAKEIIAMPSLRDATRTASFANVQTYKAGSIALPKLGDMRDILQSEIQGSIYNK
ncbi:hypothetical protein H1Q63_35530 [Desmonostoc muscorum CCALA 125]|nr:hypothetical protein [Desmonostoc muscorum CCALA 125]